MTLAYPLLHILIYLSLLFAPADSARITITGPDQSVEIVRTASGWAATTQGGKPAAVSLSDGVLTLQPEGEAPQAIPLVTFVSAAVGHDWAQEPKITLHEATTLEKTPVGFLLRLEDGTPSARTYAIAYSSAPKPLFVNVVGAVNKPGACTLPADATLLDAIAAAGGFTPRLADRQRVVITRGPAGEKPTVLTVNSEKISKKVKGPPLKDGDTVFVPEIIF